MQVRVWHLDAYIVRQVAILFPFSVAFSEFICMGTVILWQRFRCGWRGKFDALYWYLEDTSLSTCCVVEEVMVWQTMT